MLLYLCINSRFEITWLQIVWTLAIVVYLIFCVFVSGTKVYSERAKKRRAQSADSLNRWKRSFDVGFTPRSQQKPILRKFCCFTCHIFVLCRWGVDIEHNCNSCHSFIYCWFGWSACAIYSRYVCGLHVILFMHWPLLHLIVLFVFHFVKFASFYFCYFTPRLATL